MLNWVLSYLSLYANTSCPAKKNILTNCCLSNLIFVVVFFFSVYFFIRNFVCLPLPPSQNIFAQKYFCACTYKVSDFYIFYHWLLLLFLLYNKSSQIASFLNFSIFQFFLSLHSIFLFYLVSSILLTFRDKKHIFLAYLKIVFALCAIYIHSKYFRKQTLKLINIDLNNDEKIAATLIHAEIQQKKRRNCVFKFNLDFFLSVKYSNIQEKKEKDGLQIRIFYLKRMQGMM